MAPYAICEPAVETSTEPNLTDSPFTHGGSPSGVVLRTPRIITLSLDPHDLEKGPIEELVIVDFGPPRECWAVQHSRVPPESMQSGVHGASQVLAMTEDVKPDYYLSILQAIRLFGDSDGGPVREAIAFSRELLTSLEDEPIENGCLHLAEEIIRIAIETLGTVALSSIESMYCENEHRPSICAGILRCVGRQPHELVGECGTGLARRGLIHGDPEVREAAVRAFESWGGPEAISALNAHTEPVDWLADYVSQVITDLSS